MEQRYYYGDNIKQDFCSSVNPQIHLLPKLLFFYYMLANSSLFPSHKVGKGWRWSTHSCIPGSLSWMKQELLRLPRGPLSLSFTEVLWWLYQCELLEVVITYLPTTFK